MDSLDILGFFQHPQFIKVFFLTLSGLIIRQSLVISGQRWANTYHHLGTYILLPSLALIITSVIKSDIALSLGMIGALSIVRFRNPVKSPFELVMFFALLTLGITCSVSLNLAFLLFLLIIVVIFGIRIASNVGKKLGLNLFEYSFGDGNLNYTIEINTNERIEEFEKLKSLIHFYHDNKSKEYSYRLVFDGREELTKFEKSISQDKRILNIKADMQS